MLPTLQFSWLIPFLRSCSWKLSLHQLEFEEFTAPSLKKKRLRFKLKWKKLWLIRCNYNMVMTKYYPIQSVFVGTVQSIGVWRGERLPPNNGLLCALPLSQKIRRFPASWDTRWETSKHSFKKQKINLQRVMKKYLDTNSTEFPRECSKIPPWYDGTDNGQRGLKSAENFVWDECLSCASGSMWALV